MFENLFDLYSQKNDPLRERTDEDRCSVCNSSEVVVNGNKVAGVCRYASCPLGE